jgi:hypothetical protein
MQSLQGFLGGW